MVFEWWTLNWQSIAALIPLLIAAGGGIMAWARWRMDTRLKERDSEFSHLRDVLNAAQTTIKQQQETIDILGRRVNELETARNHDYAEIEELRRKVSQLEAELEKSNALITRWGQWGAEVIELLEGAKIPAPEPPVAVERKPRKRPRL
ncbi:MAG: hypothetical protein LC131_06285 [Anaerolineae bacterium]|nr:hypothetical protein [Anaerolineae bacterium]